MCCPQPRLECNLYPTCDVCFAADVGMECVSKGAKPWRGFRAVKVKSFVAIDGFFGDFFPFLSIGLSSPWILTGYILQYIVEHSDITGQ